MLGNTDKNTRSIVTTVVVAVTAGVIAVGGLTWWELAGSSTLAREQNTQNITLVGEVPGTTPALNMAQAEKLASSRAALVKRLDEARAVYKDSVGNATAFEARNMLAAYIEGTEGLLDYKPQLAENFESRAQELKEAMDDVRTGMAGKRTKAKEREEALSKMLEQRKAEMKALQEQAEKLVRQQAAEGLGA
ncbi:hypothetical protein CQR46_0100 [Bifidobacterium pseudolongum subsp. globosum]|uniref:Uncharacterized protein n=1 Tax=Bifidobacterium pseudolongum subsp. globosum TaxID=1690 RepID=A0A2N3QLM5_9BIFI|nr:hypothetical protein [Bifidobacterium pseudolongum]PKU92524.1 hypothetical protein CQR46_0100 [Bifidobacterium pseudolongum subsp. globosum]